MSIDYGTFIDRWLEHYLPNPKQYKEDIVAGLRTTPSTEGDIQYSEDSSEPIRPHSNLPTAPCQYWLKGLPPVCDYWSEGICIYGEDDEDAEVPTGYNEGICDNIGRRHWCNKYTVGGQTENIAPDETPACVAPCIERIGIGKQLDHPYVSFRPYTVDEITGYNKEDEDIQWKGRCDGLGMGRGENGYGTTTVEEMYLILPMCNLYRPSIMSFGSVTPRPIPADLDNIYDGKKSDPLIPMDMRLSFVFQMYNVRAKVQKCAYWEADSSSDFYIDDYGSSPEEFTINYDGGHCSCTDDKSKPFREPTETWIGGLPFTLQDVWAPYGGIVCNGAKPECPCYTGKWIYCTDGNTKDGMRITADQIHELRFWESNWASQEDYDAYYTQKPGPTHDGFADETTADIYTFTKWKVLDNTNSTVNESKMEGKKHHLCMPIPVHKREFNPAEYITKKAVIYPTHQELKGTHGPGDVAYPTLVRELSSDILPDIFLVFPYTSKDPFGGKPCENIIYEHYIHNTNLEQSPSIRFIGNTIRNKSLFVINTTNIIKTDPAIVYMDKYVRASSIPYKEVEYFNDAVSDLLENMEINNILTTDDSGEPIYQTGASNDTGLFNIGPVKLYHNTISTLYIICDYSGAGEYIYRKVEVEARYWAGIIQQNRFSQDGQCVNTPASFNPAGEAEGKVKCLQPDGNLLTIFPVYSSSSTSLLGVKNFYGYCINKYEKEVENVEFWTQIGPSGYIWAEVDDPEISYLFDFSVIEATMSYIGTDENKGSCSDEDISDITLEVILPVATEGPTSVNRRTIPPNAVLLKSSNPAGFFNSEWKLKIKYSYLRLEPYKGTGDAFSEIAWPEGLDDSLSNVRFSSAPYLVVPENNDGFKVLNISRGTVGVMAYFSDEEGRVQCAAATKMLLYGHQLSCKSVDIFYNYTAGSSRGYALHPQYRWWTGEKPSIQPDSFSMSNWSTPKCGDHECHTASCQGPMWYPFNSCFKLDFYNEQNGAASCTSFIEAGVDQIRENGYGMWRYCSIHLNKASVAYSPTHFWDCGTQWRHFYATYSKNDKFNGWGNIKAAVNESEYNYRSWALPPFGNSGREFVERYILKDYCSYYDLSNGFASGREYMPYVFDLPDLITDLNCFANYSNSSGLFEPFSCFPQLSLNLSELLSESFSEVRYRFEDIIESITHLGSMYPPPVKTTAGGPVTKRFGFKSIEDDNISWAWPEFWKPIERISAGQENLEYNHINATKYSRPEYYFDLDKVEHRLITDEGDNFIIFRPPKKATDEEPCIYASIALNDAHKRYFQMTYSDYDTNLNVLWMDESEEGEVGGSDSGNIYYSANNYVDKDDDGDGEDTSDSIWWIHDYNTLFDYGASSDPSDYRKAFMGYDEEGEKVYGYYNRGVITTINRSSLAYLPVTYESIGDYTLMTPLDYTTDVVKVIPKIIYIWGNAEEEDAGDNNTDPVPFKKTPLKVIVKGSYGVREVTTGTGEDQVTQTEVYCLPSVVYKEVAMYLGDDVELVTYEYKDVEEIASTEGTSGLYLVGDTSSTFQEFTIEIELARTPQRMLSNFLSFEVELTNISNEKMYIESVELYGGEYRTLIENIKVWERKYLISKSLVIDNDVIKNADGENTATYRRNPLSGKYAGQYFPFGSDVLSEGGQVMSKMTIATMNDLKTEDEPLSITKSNLITIEKEEQHKLYDAAYELEDYDTLNFSAILPPAVAGFLDHIQSIQLSIKGFLSLNQPKLTWEEHPLHEGYREGTIFYPGGHRWKWGQGRGMECWLIPSYVADLYEADWVHVAHAGSGITVGNVMYSLSGFGRLEYYEGRLASMDAMGLIEWGAPTDALTGAINGVFFRHDPED